MWKGEEGRKAYLGIDEVSELRKEVQQLREALNFYRGATHNPKDTERLHNVTTKLIKSQEMVKELIDVALDLRTYRDGTDHWNDAVMRLEELEKKFKCSST